MNEPIHGGPLAGVRILDLSQIASGPYATTLLADLGADVVKVERPIHGDAVRHADVVAGEVSGFYFGLNKGKRSIALDLKSEDGLETVRSLARWADVVVENFRPGTADQLGVGYADLSQVNPEVIYCSLSGYGPDGPMRDRPAYDVIAQALSGIMDLTGEPDRGPAKCGLPVSDLSAGTFAALGIVAALHQRHSTGRGQHVETSLLGATVAFASSYLSAAALGTSFGRYGSGHSTVAPYQAFRGADGRYFIVAAGNDRLWRWTAAAIGMEELAADPAFAKNADRIRNRDRLVEILQRAFDKQPAETWVTTLSEAGVPASLIHSLSDLADDPQMRAAGYVMDLVDEQAGAIPVVVAPLRFSDATTGTTKPAPRLNQDEAEIRTMISKITHSPTGADDGR